MLEVKAVAQGEVALVVEGDTTPGNVEIDRLKLARKMELMILLLRQRTTTRSGNKLLGKLLTSKLLEALKIRAVS